MPRIRLFRVAWRKSRHSANGADCVEVGVWAKSGYSSGANCVEATAVTSRDGLKIPAGKADTEKLILLRDSKNPDGGTLVFDEHEWGAFIAGVKDGEFDLPDDEDP
ncbi:MAG: DUF397 domain-containing protein [Streptosporangiaceae bacterium]|jgi:uncharacterized protein DUF397